MSTAYTKINILTNKKMIVSKTYLCLKKHNLSVEDYYANPQKFIEGIKDSLKSATPFPKCYLHKEKWTFDS